MTDDLLKPCPFCGGPARLGDRYESAGQRPSKNYPAAWCDACQIDLSFGQRSAWRVVEAWNRRTDPPAEVTQ